MPPFVKNEMSDVSAGTSEPDDRTKSSGDAHGGRLNILFVPDAIRAVWNERAIHLKRLNLTVRQQCDLELLMNGGFSPLNGFLNAADYHSVVTNGRLKNGVRWPIPIVLDVPDARSFAVGDEVTLCDVFGKPLAVLHIESIYRPDKRAEALAVYGTEDPVHPGVRYLKMHTGEYYLGGTVHGLAEADHHDFTALRHSPLELRSWFSSHGWQRIIGFQTRNPIHRAHFELLTRAMAENQAHLLLHPVVGLTRDGDIDYVTRVRCYQKIHRHYLDAAAAKLSLLPLAMRMAGPREAVLHAIVRKNYGCTHFIVGRDHAGPGADGSGKPFYGPYDAQAAAIEAAPDIGITIVPMPEMVYVEERQQYVPAGEVATHETVKKISGTTLRQMLHENRSVPSWFSFPEVIDELRRGAKRLQERGMTIFFTGLPSAGKSALATRLYAKLLERQDRTVSLLDGDVVRQNLSKGLGFSKADRDTNIARIGFVANEITKHGGIAICAAVAPYEEARLKNRRLISQHGRYIEVYVSTPLAICQARDPKGLYRRAKTGLTGNVTGVSDPYEPPINPEITIDTSKFTPEEGVELILKHLGISEPSQT